MHSECTPLSWARMDSLGSLVHTHRLPKSISKPCCEMESSYSNHILPSHSSNMASFLSVLPSPHSPLWLSANDFSFLLAQLIMRNCNYYFSFSLPLWWPLQTQVSWTPTSLPVWSWLELYLQAGPVCLRIFLMLLHSRDGFTWQRILSQGISFCFRFVFSVLNIAHQFLSLLFQHGHRDSYALSSENEALSPGFHQERFLCL